MMFPVSVKSRLMSLDLEEKTWFIDPETKVKHVRDTEYWGLPYGTPITPGMKPQKLKPVEALPSTTPKKPKAPKKSPAAQRAANTDETLLAHSNTQHQPKSRVHPPFVLPDGANDYQAKRFRETYESRTRIPPRNIGRYEGLTSDEMHADWSEDRSRFFYKKQAPGAPPKDPRSRSEKETGNAVSAYTGDDYAYMNGLLRQDDVAVADLSASEIRDTEKQINSMDRAMRPVGKPLLVHRTTSAPVFANLQEGDQFRDNGYVSTTIFEGYLSEVDEELYGESADVVLSILVPPEARAVYATAFQDRRGESDIGEGELVLARGTEFRVVSRDGNKLVVEVVPLDDDKATPFRDNLKMLAQSKYEEFLAEEEGEDW